MLINRKYNIGFIHIPKTGGTSIKSTLMDNLEDSYQEPYFSFHKFGLEIRDYILGYGFYNLRWFTCIRHPVDIICSSYNMNCAVISKDDANYYVGDYYQYLLKFKKLNDFEEYVRKMWIADDDFNIKRGGFFYTYCCDENGDELPIKVLHFKNLLENWNDLIKEWGLPSMQLKNLNITKEKIVTPNNISRELYKDIMDYCYIDKEKFGYV